MHLMIISSLSCISRSIVIFKPPLSKAVTDMLIFPPRSLSFSSFQNQIAHLQTIPEKKKLVPPGSSACSCRLFFTRRSRTPFYSIDFVAKHERASERAMLSIDRSRTASDVVGRERARCARERRRSPRVF